MLAPLFGAVTAATHERTVCEQQKEIVRLRADLRRQRALTDAVVSDTHLAAVLTECRAHRDNGYGGADVRLTVPKATVLSRVHRLRALGFRVVVYDNKTMTVEWTPSPPGRGTRLEPTGELPREWKLRHAEAVLHRALDDDGFPEWSDWTWECPDYIDDMHRLVHGRAFPWAEHSRAGLEFLFNPDTDEPDWTRRALTSRLYRAEHGEDAPWAAWEAAFGVTPTHPPDFR